MIELAMTEFTEKNLLNKTEDFVEYVNDFCIHIESNENHPFCFRIRNCAESFEWFMKKSLVAAKLSEKLRYIIKAQSLLDTCEDYLLLLQKVEYRDIEVPRGYIMEIREEYNKLAESVHIST